MCHIYQQNESKMIARNYILLGFIGHYFSSIDKKDPVLLLFGILMMDLNIYNGPTEVNC